MGKAIKFSLITLFSLILLIIIALVAITNLVNPNDFKGQISHQITQLTGRKLVINGNISWSFFPWLSLQVHAVELANAKGFTPKEFAKLNEMDVRLRLLPLLHGSFQMGKLVVKGLTLNLVKKADGETNWQHLVVNTDNHARNTKPIVKQKSNANNSAHTLAPLALTISGIKIQDANISYQDLQQKQTLQLTHLNFDSKDIGTNKSFPIFLSTNFAVATPQITGKIDLSGNLEYDTKIKSLPLSHCN